MLGFDCCCGQVLLWDTNCNALITGLSQIKAMYAANNIVAHLSTEWSGNLPDYSLILWSMAESDPSWWSLINGGSWGGRFHITAEFAPTFNATIDYVNSKTALHGITVNHDLLSPNTGCNANVDSVEAHQLTDGVTTITHAATASLSGGTTLSKTGADPWIAQNKVGLIDWVVAGDSNHLTDNCPGVATLNATFFLNLFNKPIP